MGEGKTFQTNEAGAKVQQDPQAMIKYVQNCGQPMDLRAFVSPSLNHCIEFWFKRTSIKTS